MDKRLLLQKNKQFYKYWMKESKDWRRNYIHVRKIFRKMYVLSGKIECPIHIMVKNLLIDYKETIFKCDYMQIPELEWANCNLDKIRMILEIAGYEYKEMDQSFYLVDGRRGKVLNACNSVEVCWQCDMIGNIGKRFSICLKEYYERKRQRYEDKRDKIALKYSINAYKTEPANGERIGIYSEFVFRLILFATIVALIIIILRIVNVYLNLEEFDEANLNIWNTLLAATLPCCVTIFTTYMLIRHEYKVDYHKERMSVLPFFSFEVIEKDVLFDNGKLRQEIQADFYETAGEDIISENVDIYQLSNIGKGVGFNITHGKGDELFDFGDIIQGRSCYISIKKMDTLYYPIDYNDIYGNKYTQLFEMKRVNDKCHVKSFPPSLVLRTKRVRYQQ